VAEEWEWAAAAAWAVAWEVAWEAAWEEVAWAAVAWAAAWVVAAWAAAAWEAAAWEAVAWERGEILTVQWPAAVWAARTQSVADVSRRSTCLVHFCTESQSERRTMLLQFLFSLSLPRFPE
jgi:hypothetical protein